MIIKKGDTDITRYVMLVDSSDGTPETSYTITNLDLTYIRERATASKTDATALAAVDSAHGDNKAIQVDGTNCPGLYRIDWPDAAFASGVDKVVLVVNGSGLHPAVEEIDLVDYDPQDSVRMGMTALPNAAADAAGGLPISDAGGLDLDAIKAKTDNLPSDPADQSQIIAAADAIVADIAGLNDLSAAAVNAEVDTALGDYDGPTKAEMDSGLAGLNDLSAAEVNAEVDTALGDYDAPTKAEMDSGFAALNDLSAAQVNAEVDTALADYDGPTKTEMDSGFAGLETRSGTAQAGGASTITLDAGASSIDNYYQDQICQLDGGTGAGQSGIVESSVGATKVCTMSVAWATAPDNTTTFTLRPLGSIAGASAPTVGQIADAVLDEARADHDEDGSVGQALLDIEAVVAPQKVMDNAKTGQTKVYEENATDVRFTQAVQAGDTDDEVKLVRV